MKKIIIFFSLLFTLLPYSCTNLEEGIYDQQVADEFYSTTQGINSALAGIYNEIRGDWGGVGYAGADRGWYDLNEVCTDEFMLPIREDGGWSDNGIWVQMYRHEFTPAHEFLGQTWNWLYRSVFKANLAIELLVTAEADPNRIAEAKVARAFFYWLLMDGWGDVPYYTENNVLVEELIQKPRAELFEVIEQELIDNADLMDETKGGEMYGRFNKWAAYALLAKLYLNAERYTGQERWEDCISVCDKIINEGGFSLHADYFELFGDFCPDDEVIMAIYIDAIQAPRNILSIRSFGPNHCNNLFGFSCWNGATAHQNFINKFDDIDIRKSQWLIGDVLGNGSVVYDIDINSLESAGIFQGARNAKFYPVLPIETHGSSNDFPIFRYADILLMKAECQTRLGIPGAKELLDQVRARAGLLPLGMAPNLMEIYDERGRELCWEGHRRMDMIRFGTFLEAHDFKPASDQKFLLFPIPISALDANSNLKQNDGY